MVLGNDNSCLGIDFVVDFDVDLGNFGQRFGIGPDMDLGIDYVSDVVPVLGLYPVHAPDYHVNLSLFCQHSQCNPKDYLDCV